MIADVVSAETVHHQHLEVEVRIPQQQAPKKDVGTTSGSTIQRSSKEDAGQSVVHKVFPCPHCDAVLTSKRRFENHVPACAFKEERKSSEKNRVKGESTPKRMHEHSVGTSDEETSKNRTISTENMVCPHCARVFVQPRSFEKHVQSCEVASVPPIKECVHCKKKYHNLGSLKKHEQKCGNKNNDA